MRIFSSVWLRKKKSSGIALCPQVLPLLVARCRLKQIGHVLLLLRARVVAARNGSECLLITCADAGRLRARPSAQTARLPSLDSMVVAIIPLHGTRRAEDLVGVSMRSVAACSAVEGPQTAALPSRNGADTGKIPLISSCDVSETAALRAEITGLRLHPFYGRLQLTDRTDGRSHGGLALTLVSLVITDSSECTSHFQKTN